MGEKKVSSPLSQHEGMAELVRNGSQKRNYIAPYERERQRQRQRQKERVKESNASISIR